jgi:hypothetical protein
MYVLGTYLLRIICFVCTDIDRTMGGGVAEGQHEGGKKKERDMPLHLSRKQCEE